MPTRALPDELDWPDVRRWLTAAPEETAARAAALEGCLLDDAVSDREWLIAEVTSEGGVRLSLMDAEDPDGARTAQRKASALSADALLIIPEDLPPAQRALLAEAVAPAASGLEADAAAMLEAMGLPPGSLGGGSWPVRIARVAWLAESGEAVPRMAMQHVHERLRALDHHRPAAALFGAIADDDPEAHTRAVARFYAAVHWRDLGRPDRSLEVSEPLFRGHRHVKAFSERLLAAVLLQRAACHADLGDFALADRALRWSFGIEQSDAARELFKRLDRERR